MQAPCSLYRQFKANEEMGAFLTGSFGGTILVVSGGDVMEFAEYFPVWDQLEPKHQEKLRAFASHRHVRKGTILHSGEMNCIGVLLIHSGQLRAYSISGEGREVTLYRLFERDICIFSASCVMPNIMFDILIEAEKDTDVWVIPPSVYRTVGEESAPMANYTNQIIASRFSDVMWTMDQIMWKSFDKRLAAFLVEESVLEGTLELKITHEKIANHMGTAREVVTRMLRYFQNEGMVKLTRGAVELLDVERLEKLNNSDN